MQPLQQEDNRSHYLHPSYCIICVLVFLSFSLNLSLSLFLLLSKSLFFSFICCHLRSVMYPAVMSNLLGSCNSPQQNGSMKEFKDKFTVYDEGFEYGSQLPDMFLRWALLLSSLPLAHWPNSGEGQWTPAESAYVKSWSYLGLVHGWLSMQKVSALATKANIQPPGE